LKLSARIAIGKIILNQQNQGRRLPRREGRGGRCCRAGGGGVAVSITPHLGKVGHTWVVQHGALSDIKLTKKQTLSPGLMLLIFVVTVVDWPFCNGVGRSVSCGLRVNVLSASGVSRICDITLPELLVTVNV
jgi:hypothetical protein